MTRCEVALLVCTACAGGESPAPPCPSTAAPGEVTVTTRMPAKVLFHDEQGTILSSTQSVFAGVQVSGTIPACGAVTAIEGSDHILTVTQLQPGDHVSFVDPEPTRTGARHHLSVAFPLVAGATTYGFTPAHSGVGCECQGVFVTASPAELDLDDCCIAADDTTAIVAVAGDAFPFTYASLERLRVPAGGTSTASIVVWSSERSATRFAYSDPSHPARWSNVAVTQLAGALDLVTPGIAAVSPPGEIELARVGDRVLLRAFVSDPDTSALDVMVRALPAPLPDVVDLATLELPPHVASVRVHPTDDDRPVVSWTTERATTDEHLIAIDVQHATREWTLFAPPDQPGAVRFPELPSSLHFGEVLGVRVQVVRSGVLQGYDQARQQPLEVLGELSTVPHPVPDGFAFRYSQR